MEQITFCPRKNNNLSQAFAQSSSWDARRRRLEQDTTSCPKERQNKHKNCNRNKSQTQDFCILNPVKKETEMSYYNIQRNQVRKL